MGRLGFVLKPLPLEFGIFGRHVETCTTVRKRGSCRPSTDSNPVRRLNVSGRRSLLNIVSNIVCEAVVVPVTLIFIVNTFFSLCSII